MKTVTQLKEWRGKTRDELVSEFKKLKEELFRLRLRKVTDVIENPAVIREITKNIARLNTLLRERELKAINEKIKKG
jgi:large subunit ribosomal protein L29